MVCPNCGREINSPFCGYCGYAVPIAGDDEKTVSMRRDDRRRQAPPRPGYMEQQPPEPPPVVQEPPAEPPVLVEPEAPVPVTSLIPKTFASPLMLAAAIAFTLRTLFIALSSILAAINASTVLPAFSVGKIVMLLLTLNNAFGFSGSGTVWLWELLGLIPCVVITVGLWICCFSASSVRHGRKMSTVGLYLILGVLALDLFQFVVVIALDFITAKGAAVLWMLSSIAKLDQVLPGNVTLNIITGVLFLILIVLFYLSTLAMGWLVLQGIRKDQLPKRLPVLCAIYCFVFANCLLLLQGGIFQSDLVHGLAYLFSLVSFACFGCVILQFRDKVQRFPQE